jgi:hypothetical protein
MTLVSTTNVDQKAGFLLKSRLAYPKVGRSIQKQRFYQKTERCHNAEAGV